MADDTQKKRRRRRKKKLVTPDGNQISPIVDDVKRPEAPSVNGDQIVITLEPRHKELMDWATGGDETAKQQLCQKLIRAGLIQIKRNHEKEQLEDQAHERFKGS